MNAVCVLCSVVAASFVVCVAQSFTLSQPNGIRVAKGKKATTSTTNRMEEQNCKQAHPLLRVLGTRKKSSEITATLNDGMTTHTHTHTRNKIENIIKKWETGERERERGRNEKHHNKWHVKPAMT